MKRFFPFAMALAAFLFSCSTTKQGYTITITDPQSKLTGKELKEGLNIVDNLKDGYKIGLIRKSGAKDEWVTVAPDGRTTKKVTSEAGSSNAKSLTAQTNIMVWKCTKVGGDTGWTCNCVAHCDF
jgi:hypothetical protein